MKKLFTMLIASLCGTMVYAAQTGVISLKNVSMKPGKTGTMEVVVNTPSNYTAFQFDLTLPKGVSVKSASMNGNYGNDRTLEKKLIDQTANKYRFLSYDMKNAAFTGSGVVAKIVLEAGSEAESGTLAGSSLLVVTPQGQSTAVASASANLTIEKKVSITISDFGKKTFSSDKDLDFSSFGDNLKAYVATGYEPTSAEDGMGGTVWMTRVMDVPAGTGIFLKGTPGTYEVPVATSKSFYKNMMIGTGNSSVSIQSSTNDYVNLYLTTDDAGSALMFRTIAGNGRTQEANSAYLQIPKPFKERPASAAASEEAIAIVADQGKGTYCSANDLDFTSLGDNLKAYIATGYTNTDGTVWMTRVLDVPAGVGIFLKGAKGTYNVPTKVKSNDSRYSSVYTNMLVGTLQTTSIPQKTSDMTNYFLGIESGVMKFYMVADGGRSIDPNRAYLQIPTSALSLTRGVDANGSSSEAYEYGFVDDVIGIPVERITGYETGISTIGLTEEDNDAWYNLNGQRIDTPTRKGLFIHNGKKVVVK